jgi:siderophore synthetase component
MGGPISGRILIDSLRQMARFTSTCVLTAAERQADLTTRLMDLVRAESDARQEQLQQLQENAMRAMQASTRLAEATATRFEALETRIVAFERALGWRKPADIGDDDASGP